MNVIRQVTLFFAIIIVLIISGLALVYNRIQAMDVAHHRLMEEWKELRVISELEDTIDQFKDHLSLGEVERIKPESVKEFIAQMESRLELIHAESVNREEFEESSHTQAEGQDFSKIYVLFSDFRTIVVHDDQGRLSRIDERDHLLERLEALRQAVVDLQSIYVQGMGDASNYAQRIRFQISQRILVITLILLVALGCLAAWFIHLIKKNMQAMIDREKGLTIGLTAQSLAHEIRNPLSIIKSSASVIKEKLPVDSEERELADYLIDESQRISQMIEQLLHLNTTRRPELRPEIISAIIDEIVSLLQGAARKSTVTLELINQLGETRALCARNELKQVFINLMLNAIYASGQGGRVVINCLSRNNAAVIEVIDSGKGFDPESVKKAFTPFYTTKNSGSGLGLFIAKSIVQAHNGTIEIVPTFSDGGKVVVTLPIIRENAHG